MVAKWFGVATTEVAENVNPVDEIMTEHPRAIMQEIFISEENHAVGKQIVELNFPKKAIIAMIKRNDKYLTPNGLTKIEANDVFVVISDNQEGMSEVYDMLEIVRQ